MSAAPRAWSLPSLMVGTKGSVCHLSSGPGGTTSVWPASATSGRALPWRIQRLVTSPHAEGLRPEAQRREAVDDQLLAALVGGRDRRAGEEGLRQLERFVLHRVSAAGECPRRATVGPTRSSM